MPCVFLCLLSTYSDKHHCLKCSIEQGDAMPGDVGSGNEQVGHMGLVSFMRKYHECRVGQGTNKKISKSSVQ